MQYSIHTDLAIEASAVENLKSNDNTQNGIVSNVYQKDDITVTEVRITNEKGERAVGKPMGNYITIEIPTLKNNISDV